MANIAQNSTYDTSQGTDIAASIGDMLKQSGVPFAKEQGVPSSQGQTDEEAMIQQYGANTVPTETQFLPPITQQPQPVPSDYSGFVPAGQIPGTPNSTITPVQPEVAPLGGDVSGQFVQDATNPTAMVKSVRGYNPEENAAILNGRSSALYQIDHIVPLELGGADTMGNREVLNMAQNDQKTKAQAVPYTLYSHGLITLDAARTMAADWKDRDTTDLPEPDNVGMVPLATATTVAQRWESTAGTPQEQSQQFWSSVPQAEQDFGQGFLPDSVREFIKGFGTGATMGFLPYQQGTNETADGTISIPGIGSISTDKLAGDAGIMAGGVASFMLGGEVLDGVLGAFGVGARAVSALTGIGGGAAVDAGLTAADEAAAAAADGTSFVKADDGATSYLQGLKNKVFPPGLAKSAARFGVQNAVMGQAQQLISNHYNPSIFAGTQQPQQEQNTAANILTDLATGYLAGIVPGKVSLKYVPSFVSPRIQSTALAMAPITLGTLFLDPEHPINALTNGAIFGTMHLAGGAGIMSAGQKDTAMLDHQTQMAEATQRATQFADRGAYEILGNYSPSTLPSLKPGDLVPDSAKDPATVQTAHANAVNALWDRFYFDKNPDGSPSSGGMTLDTANKELGRINAAASWLQSAGTDPVTQQNMRVQMLQNLTGEQKTGAFQQALQFGRPAVATQAANALDDSFMQKSFNENNLDEPSGQYPNGSIAVTGAGIDTNTPQAKYFFAKKAAGQASPNILLIDRPDTAYVWRMRNSRITTEQISNGSYAPDPNPENALQAFGITLDQQGNKELVPLGWVASDFRTNKGTGPKDSTGRPTHQAFNLHPAVQSGDLAPIQLHKDDVAPAMRQNGVKVLVANLDYRATPQTLETQMKFGGGKGLPFIPVNVNDQNWEYSKSLADKMNSQGGAQDTLQGNVASVNAAVNAKSKAQDISQIRNKVQSPASQMLPTVPQPTASVSLPQASTREVLALSESALSENSPEAIQSAFKDKLGVFLTDEQANTVFESRNDMSVKDTLQVISNAVENGQTDGRLGPVMENFVKPYLESDTFKAGSLAKTFPSLRSLGGIESRAKNAETQARASQPVLSDDDVKTLRKQGFDDATIARMNSQGSVRPSGNVNVTNYSRPAESADEPVPSPAPVRGSPSSPTPPGPAPAGGASVVTETSQQGQGARVITTPAQALEDRIMSSAATVAPTNAARRSLLEGPFASDVTPKKTPVNTGSAEAMQAEEEGRLPRSVERYANFGNDEDSYAGMNSQNKKATTLGELANPATMSKAAATGGGEVPQVAPAVTGPRPQGPLGHIAVTPVEAFNFIEEGLTADKNTPAFAHANAMDSVLKTVFGKNYRANPEAQKVMTDPGFWENIFSNQVNSAGREETQDKDVLEAMASGDRNKMDQAIQSRRARVQEFARSDQSSGESSVIGDKNVTPDIQNDNMVHDLTFGESRLMPGIASEQDMTNAQAVRDVKTLFLGTGKQGGGLLKYINSAREAAGQKKASLPMTLFKTLESNAIKADAENTAKQPEMDNAENELVDLGKKYTALTKALQAAPDPNLQSALEDVKAAISKYSSIAGRSEAPQSSGQ